MSYFIAQLVALLIATHAALANAAEISEKHSESHTIRRALTPFATSKRPASAASYFAICTVAKDQHADIREWAEYHHKMGAGKIYIFDNLSKSPMLDEIHDFVEAGFVEYTYIHRPHGINLQQYIYDRCLYSYGGDHVFMAFVDVDDFIVVGEPNVSIPQVLCKYEQYGGLSLNVRIFGSSGHVKRPPGGVISNYHKCYDNTVVRSVVNTMHTWANKQAHIFEYKHPFFAVDVNEHKQTGPFNPGRNQIPDKSLFSVIFINHYMLKSGEEYQQKKRLDLLNITFKEDKNWKEVERLCSKSCPDLLFPHTALPLQPAGPASIITRKDLMVRAAATHSSRPYVAANSF